MEQVEKQIPKSVQSESGKERSDEDNKREHSTESQAQIKKDDKRIPVLMKPATYDGKSSWLDYKSHFEACATLGHWSEEDKAMYLAVSLRGQAQSVLGDLAGGVPKKYKELITALNERFSPPNQMELHRAQLRERKQRATNSLQELGQSIRRLTNLAYPTAPYDVRETLSKEYFIDALIDSDIRLRIKQSRPATLNDAIRQAVELEAFVKVEEKNKELKGYIRPVDVTEPEQSKTDKELQKLLSRLEELQKEMKELKSQKQGQSAQQTGVYRDHQRVVCPVCGRLGHYGKDCFFKDRPGSGRGRSQGRGQVGGIQTRTPTKGSRKQSGIKRSSEKSGQCKEKAEKSSNYALRKKHIDVKSRLGDVSPENSLRQLQKEDKDVSTIKQLIESNSRPDTTAMSFNSESSLVTKTEISC